MSVSKVVIVLFLGWLNVIVPLAGQVTLTSSLDVGQRFTCPRERVSYICRGPGPSMNLYAPPLLSRNDGAAFLITNIPGETGFVDGPFTATLLSVNPLIGQLTIDTSNISLINLEVICESGSFRMNMSQQEENTDGVNEITDGSSVPEDGDLYLGVMKSIWTAPSGNFDIDCYEVSVCMNNEPAPLMKFNTTDTSMTATYSGTVGDTAYASIVVISKCGVRSVPFETNRVSPQLSGSVIAIIVFMLIFLVGFVAVLVGLIVVLITGTK